MRSSPPVEAHGSERRLLVRTMPHSYGRLWPTRFFFVRGPDATKNPQQRAPPRPARGRSPVLIHERRFYHGVSGEHIEVRLPDRPPPTIVRDRKLDDPPGTPRTTAHHARLGTPPPGRSGWLAAKGQPGPRPGRAAAVTYGCAPRLRRARRRAPAGSPAPIARRCRLDVALVEKKHFPGQDLRDASPSLGAPTGRHGVETSSRGAPLLRSAANGFGKTLEMRWPEHPHFPTTLHHHRHDLDGIVVERAPSGSHVFQGTEHSHPSSRAAEGAALPECQGQPCATASGTERELRAATCRGRRFPVRFGRPRHEP